MWSVGLREGFVLKDGTAEGVEGELLELVLWKVSQVASEGRKDLHAQ